MSRRIYTVACLAGDGVGPELMAEASRALAEVSRLHGFEVDDIHVPFGTEAFGAQPGFARLRCRQGPGGSERRSGT